MSWTIKSFEKYRLMAPGPVALHPEVLCALSAPMVHHRTPLFDQVLKSALTKLRLVFQTQQPVYIINGTGSTGMEAALVNVLSPGDEVLCLVSGKFGERWRDMAQVFGYKVHSVDVPWGQAVAPEQVLQVLKKYPQIKAVLCQVCETSTAVLHPIKELAEIIKKQNPRTLFLVDAITAAGTLDLPMDEWKLDAVVAGSQKAFMLPTGLSFVAFSSLAQEQFSKARTPRYASDIQYEKKANEKGETYFSSSVTLIRALDKALDVMLEKGLATWFLQIQKKAEWTRLLAPQLNLKIYSQAPSPSLTALQVPEKIDGQKLREHMESQYNVTVMGGQDSLKGKILRIGHMGYILKDDLLALAGALYLSLKDLGYRELPPEDQFYAFCESSLKDFK
jgi:aspartate aminotransferase-like enzyme